VLAIWAVFAVLVTVGVILNHFNGAPPVPAVAPPPEMPGGKAAAPGGDLQLLVPRLRQKLAADPGNGEGWLLLARSHGQLRQYGDAVAAYRRAAELLPADAGLLADWTDAQVMANQGRWDDAARQLVGRALALDRRHVKTLALAGSAAFDRRDYASAVGFWNEMKAAAPAGSIEARLAEANIAEAVRRRDAQP
jgi:cytochrome c-type biogenesis protein CcmH